MKTVKISDIKIKSGRRPVDPVNISEIAASIKDKGKISN